MLRSISVFLCLITLVFDASLSLAEDIDAIFSSNSPVLTLKDALTMGIQKNLEINVAKLNMPISKENVNIEKAAFDPVFETGISSLEQKTPTSTAFSSDDFNLFRETSGSIGIRKKFQFGLESSISFNTGKSQNNSSVDGLRPQYNNKVTLNFMQPLLKDFGIDVNTTSLQISHNQVSQKTEGYMDIAQRIGEKIEIAYYDLAEAMEILRYRMESRQLAWDLLEGNREKFKQGVVPVTDVQEAETEVAARDEKVLFALQEMETAENRLRDLLGIRPGEALYKKPFRTEAINNTKTTVPSFESSLETAVRKRPDLAIQRLEIENSNIQIRFYENQKLPRLDLEATLGANGLSGGKRTVSFSGYEGTSPLSGSYGDSISRMAEADGYEWIAGVMFSYPIGNRAARAQAIRTDTEKRQAILTLKRMEETAETEIKNAIVTAKRSLERVKVAERFEKLAETTLSQEMERLKEGLSDTFRILDFQENLIEARIRKANALTDVNQGLAMLYRAMGTNLEKFDIAVSIN
jgi:outer membrane protein TolC